MEHHWRLFSSHEFPRDTKAQEILDLSKIKHAGSFKKHLKRKHSKEYGEMLHEEDVCRRAKLEEANKNKKKLSVLMSADDLRDACIQLVTVSGRPFSFVEDVGFRAIIDPILKALPSDQTFTISRTTVRDMVKTSAIELRETIAQELKEIPLISLKMDIATRHQRSFLGINVQYIKDGILHLRTLAVKELMSSHTGEYLKEMVLEILSSYNITIDKLYSCTTDNGEEEENEGIAVDPYREEEMDFLAILTLFRCGLHTMQLSVTDVLEDPAVKASISKAREAVKALRTDTCLKTLRQQNIKKLVLDVVTRWNSTADMLQSFVAAKTFCVAFAKNKPELALTNEDWERVEKLLLALKPCKTATLKMQKENLLPGDFFGSWRECKRKTEKVNSTLAIKLAKSLERREKTLLQHESLLSSMFLDVRYLPFLSPEERKIAKEHLKTIWFNIETSDKRGINNSSADNSSNSTDADMETPATSSEEEALDVLEMERMSMDAARRRNFVEVSSIDRLLETHEQCPSIPKKENILTYWECRKQSQPELYTLSKIDNAVPMTQVSVERLFSGMKFIFSALRGNLSHDILDDILILRTNNIFMQKNSVSTVVPQGSENPSNNEPSNSLSTMNTVLMPNAMDISD